VAVIITSTVVVS